MDSDLEQMSREQLLKEVRKLRNGIRTHRDSTGHELCWYHPALWGLLPERTNPLPTVPQWPQFMQGCVLCNSLWAEPWTVTDQVYQLIKGVTDHAE